MVKADHPFLSKPIEKPLVALKGQRNGYIMLAPSRETLHYADLDSDVLLAAKAWLTQLEQLGSPRAYWIVLSEVTPHLHIHLFPRWPQDTLSGLPLFESRENLPQPQWTDEALSALKLWAAAYQVEIL